MVELDKYIKEWNLVFTDTVDRLDFCREDFDVEKAEVNYESSLNLLHLVSSFNLLYLLFKKEYDKLIKLDLGENVEVLGFDRFDFDGDNYRLLTLYINEPTIINRASTILFLREINGEIKPFVSNNKNPYDKFYYRIDVELDKGISKKYLDLFEKYSLLLSTYRYIRNSQIFGDSTNCIFTSIDDYDSNLLDGLSKLKISIGSTYFNTEHFIEILINLGENFGIDYDGCKFILDNEEKPVDKETFDRVLREIYINKKYTKVKKIN